NCTLVRRGNAGWCSRRGPSERASASSSRSGKRTQCGFPSERAVIATTRSSTWRGTPTASPSVPLIGTSHAWKLAHPISTVTDTTRPATTSHAHPTTPPTVSTLNRAPLAPACSYAYFANNPEAITGLLGFTAIGVEDANAEIRPRGCDLHEN